MCWQPGIKYVVELILNYKLPNLNDESEKEISFKLQDFDWGKTRLSWISDSGTWCKNHLARGVTEYVRYFGGSKVAFRAESWTAI
jgi:hypothetical protein